MNPVVNLYAVGKIVRCFGTNGFVKVYPVTHSLERFVDLRQVFIGISTLEAIPFMVESVILKPGYALVKLCTLDDRTSAEGILGRYLFVDENEVSRPGKGSYYIHEIIGCEVMTIEGKILGTVENVYKLPAQDVWVIRCKEKCHLIPAIKDIVKKVEIKKRRIFLHLIDGLFEIEG